MNIRPNSSLYERNCNITHTLSQQLGLRLTQPAHINIHIPTLCTRSISRATAIALQVAYIIKFLVLLATSKPETASKLTRDFRCRQLLHAKATLRLLLGGSDESSLLYLCEDSAGGTLVSGRGSDSVPLMARSTSNSSPE
jgi:hypothetical protein